MKVIAEVYEKSQVAELDNGNSCGQKDICGRETATAKSLQSCLTLCDPIDGSPPGFPVPGILQVRVLEWGAIAFSY